MGYKLLILLALLIGVLYGLHLLVKDFQSFMAGSRLLRMLFKRDTSSQNYTKPVVRWKRILQYDPIQCARYFYCELGARPASNEIRQGFIYMLMLKPSEENRSAHVVFKEAFEHGKIFPTQCRAKYPMCIFDDLFLFDIIRYLLRHPEMELIEGK